MTNEELAYLNRIRTQSRGITAFRTTAYFKKKERPSCDRKQLDLDTFCKMPCVCDLSTGVEEMTDHLRLLDVPVSDYCSTVWNNLNACYIRYMIENNRADESGFFEKYSWLRQTNTASNAAKQLWFASLLTCAHIHEMIAMRRLYSSCLAVLELPAPEPYRFFELLDEAASCTNALDLSIARQVDALEIEIPALRTLYSERLRIGTLPVVGDLSPEYGKMPTNGLPIFPLVPCYQQFCQDHSTELQKKYGTSYSTKVFPSNKAQTAIIPYWRNAAVFPDIECLFQAYIEHTPVEEIAIVNSWDIHGLARTYLESMDQYLSFRIADCYPTVDSIDGCIYWAADKLDAYAFLSLHMEICSNSRTRICPICNRIFYPPTDYPAAIYCSRHTEKQKETYRKKINHLNGGSVYSAPSSEICVQETSQFNVKAYFRNPCWPLGYWKPLNIDNNMIWSYAGMLPADLERMQDAIITFEAATDCYHQQIYKDILTCCNSLKMALPDEYKWLRTGHKTYPAHYSQTSRDKEYARNWLAAQITLCRFCEVHSISLLYESCLEELRMGACDSVRFFSLLDRAVSCIEGFERSIDMQANMLEIHDSKIKALYKKMLCDRSLSLPFIRSYRCFANMYKWPKTWSKSSFKRLKEPLYRTAQSYGDTDFLPIISDFDGKRLAQALLKAMDQYLSLRIMDSRLQLHSVSRSTDWTTDRIDVYGFFYLYLEICANTHYKICPICQSVFVSDTYHPDKLYCSAHTKRQIERYREKHRKCQIEV